MTADRKSMLWVHSLDSGVIRVLVEQASVDVTSATPHHPFWSPDSRNLGYFANSKVNRISADGGAVQPLCDAPVGVGGSCLVA